MFWILYIILGPKLCLDDFWPSIMDGRGTTQEMRGDARLGTGNNKTPSVCIRFVLSAGKIFCHVHITIGVTQYLLIFNHVCDEELIRGRVG